MFLYRFIDVSAFIDIIASSQMYLRQVMTWDDPYETDAVTHLMSNLLEKTDLAILDPSPAASAKVTQLRGTIRKAILEQDTKFIYAQSWTEESESDALWRIYSPDKKGLRLSVDLDTLLKEMAKTLPNVDHFRVEYCTSEEARTRLLARFNESKSMNLTSCCRYKRREFDHELEYRFCIVQYPRGFQKIDLEPFDLNNEESLEKAVALFHDYRYDEVRYYHFEPSLIHEVTLDPRFDPDSWFEKAIRKLCAPHGITVRRSDLYTRPV